MPEYACCFKIDIFINMLINISSAIDSTDFSMSTEVLLLAWSDCGGRDEDLWQTLAYSGILWHTLAYSSILWHTLAYSGIFWHTLAYSGILWHTLVYSGILWHT